MVVYTYFKTSKAYYRNYINERREALLLLKETLI